MVEVLVVNVEPVYADRQVITYGIFRRKCVHNPFVARLSDGYITTNGQIMDRKLNDTIYFRTVIKGEHKLKVIVVISRAT